MDPKHIGYKAYDTLLGRRWYRRLVDGSLSSVAEVAKRESPAREA